MVEESAIFDLDDRGCQNEINEIFDSLYFDNVSETADIVLTNEEIIILVQKILEGDQEARDFLINAHIKTAESLAWSVYKNGNRSVDLEDLKSIAYMGLCKATELNCLRNFDANRHKTDGNIFNKYAFWYIKGALLNAVYKQMGITRTERDIHTAVKKLEKRMVQEGAEWPTEFNDRVELIVKELGLEEFKVRTFYTKYWGQESLDNNQDDGEKEERRNLYNFVASAEPSVERTVISKMILQDVYSNLNKEQKRILDCVQEEGMYNWLLYPRHYGEIAKRIHGKYEDLTEEEKSNEKKRISKAIIEIRNITKQIFLGSEKQITEIIQRGTELNKFEEYLAACIGEYNREELKEKVQGYLREKKYADSSQNVRTIFNEGYFTSNGMPLRNELIAIAFAEGISALQLNTLLKKSGCSELYIRQPEDLALYYALNHKYDLEQYLQLCNKLKEIVKPDIEKIENDLVIGKLKKRLEAYELIEESLEDSDTITNRMFNGTEKWLKGGGTEKEFVEYVKNNKENFVIIRERTYRVIMELLINYIEKACSTYRNTYNSEITMNTRKPIDERKIRTMGILEQMVEFCNGDQSEIDTNKRNYLSRMIRSYSAEHKVGMYPFELTRDTFLSMAAFFMQYEDYGDDRKNGFIDSMNEVLKKAGFDELDENIARDKCIINVGMWGKISENNMDKVDYEVYFDGIVGITESKRRSQYSFL